MQDFNAVLKMAASEGASDIHLSIGCPVSLRVDGRLKKSDEIIFGPEDMEGLLALFLTGEMALKLKERGELTVVYPVEGLGNFRISIYKKNGTLASAIRIFPEKAPLLYDLRAPESVKELLKEPSGLIIVGGRAGSGRSTTVAAMLNEINSTLERHVVGIEENIEFSFKNDRSVIDLRRLAEDTPSYREGIRAAIREDADIIMISELEDKETAEEAILAAESGNLVISSMRIPDSISAIKRILDFFEAGRQGNIKERLSGSLCGILCQSLVPLTEGGRAAAFEFLLLNQAVKNLLKEGRFGQITAIMQADHRLGMTTMDDSLFELYTAKRITAETAMFFSRDRDYLEQRIHV
ncbi:MAG: PilT/PilU family type 4a pilus ATPase [Lachnospiraceae bacterium]|nr:PilT/PilU family type 4a pilus ATPase [Lachnospiraceae bacterium]